MNFAERVDGSTAQPLFGLQSVEWRLWGDEIVVFVPSTGCTHVLSAAASAVLATMTEHPDRCLSGEGWLALMGAPDMATDSNAAAGPLGAMAGELAGELTALDGVLHYLELNQVAKRVAFDRC